MKALANIFAVVSLVALGYWALVSLNAHRYQVHEMQRFAMKRQTNSSTIAPFDSRAKEQRTRSVLEPDVAMLAVPRLELSTVVIEGAGENELKLAPGHIRGTSLPGGGGNIGIAGHRDTFFRPLRGIRSNDMIAIVTTRHEYHYRVVSTEIVRPGDIWVLYPTPRETLTLVTCYPFDFIGAAPKRFIVRAECVDCSQGSMLDIRRDPGHE